MKKSLIVALNHPLLVKRTDKNQLILSHLEGMRQFQEPAHRGGWSTSKDSLEVDDVWRRSLKHKREEGLGKSQSGESFAPRKPERSSGVGLRCVRMPRW
ncbi:hypothetical protein BSKO_02288 [Bryopsis sp. KO-2023]|nr:hypothetical protein BSKO_02288 [Bryopsis sp. KO-2023]